MMNDAVGGKLDGFLEILDRHFIAGFRQAAIDNFHQTHQEEFMLATSQFQRPSMW